MAKFKLPVHCHWMLRQEEIDVHYHLSLQHTTGPTVIVCRIKKLFEEKLSRIVTDEGMGKMLQGKKNDTQIFGFYN